MSAVRIAPGVYRDPYTGVSLYPGVEVPPPAGDPAPPIERRRATPEELARLSGPVEPPKPRVSTHGHLTDEEVAERRRRGTEAMLARRAVVRPVVREPKPPKPKPDRRPRTLEELRRPRTMRVTDEQALAALRATSGNRNAAARLLGVTAQSVNHRVDVLARHGLLPDDVAASIRRYRS